MTRLLNDITKLIVLLVILTVESEKDVAFAQSIEEVDHTQLRMVAVSAGGSQNRSLPATLKWEGREYDIESGIGILMGVVRNCEKPANERHLALLQLSMLGGHLRTHSCLDELRQLFDRANSLERGAILLCFKASDDARGIPLFIDVLEREHDVKLRFSAAVGLAQWNVRRGVAELVKLLDSEEAMPQPSQLFYVRDNAMRSFRLMNIRKAWGFPDDKESAEWPPDVMPRPDVVARLKPPPAVEEIKKWWTENQGRFPDWKPGDPLPQVSPNESVEAPGPAKSD